MLQVMKRFITPVYRLFTHNLKMFVKNSNNPVFGFFSQNKNVKNHNIQKINL